MPVFIVAYEIDFPEESEVLDALEDQDPEKEADQDPDQEADQDEIILDQDNNDIIMDGINDVNKNVSDVDEKIDSVSEDVKNVAEAVADGNSLIKAMNDRETKEEEVKDVDILNLIHEDNQKIMISLWSLFGLLLGTRLIKGMFGNG
jgi:septal ring factor EnvC (AmiA/AmiB activator)